MLANFFLAFAISIIFMKQYVLFLHISRYYLSKEILEIRTHLPGSEWHPNSSRALLLESTDSHLPIPPLVPAGVNAGHQREASCWAHLDGLPPGTAQFLAFSGREALSWFTFEENEHFPVWMLKDTFYPSPRKHLFCGHDLCSDFVLPNSATSLPSPSPSHPLDSTCQYRHCDRTVIMATCVVKHI